MVDFTEDQKKEIFDRMADEHTTPDTLAKELKCKLADIMDAVVDVITSSKNLYPRNVFGRWG